MRPFTKNEIVGILLIFLVVFVITFKGLMTSERRARDAQRMGDLGAISDALYKYQADFSFFPATDNGKIKACKADNFDDVITEMAILGYFDKNIYFRGLRGCDWGRDPLRDVQDLNYSPYLQTLPSDPRTVNGIFYIYFSNIGRFQLYTYLEGETDEDGYNEGIVKRNLACGAKICNFGKSSDDTPLDRSIEDYERELFDKAQAGIKE